MSWQGRQPTASRDGGVRFASAACICSLSLLQGEVQWMASYHAQMVLRSGGSKGTVDKGQDPPSRKDTDELQGNNIGGIGNKSIATILRATCNAFQNRTKVFWNVGRCVCDEATVRGKEARTGQCQLDPCRFEMARCKESGRTALGYEVVIDLKKAKSGKGLTDLAMAKLPVQQCSGLSSIWGLTLFVWPSV